MRYEMLLSMSAKYLNFSAAGFRPELQGIFYITYQQVGHNVCPRGCHNQIFDK